MWAGEVRYYLHNIESLKGEIDSIIDEIKLFESMDFDTIGVQVCDGMPHGKGQTKSKVECIALDRVQYIHKQRQQLVQKILIRNSIMSVITCLDPVDKQVIDKKYLIKVQGKRQPTFAQIAHQMHCSESEVRRIDRKVVYKIIDRYEDKIKSPG